MTGSATQITVSNRSLLSVGSQAQISSFNEVSPQANACATLFTPVFESLARSAPWNCLRKQATLTLFQAAQGTPENPSGTAYTLPPNPWLYAYLLPSDCLQVRSLVPMLPPLVSGGVPIFSTNVGAATWLPQSGNIPFAVAYATDADNNPMTVILTNQSQAVAIYTVSQSNPIIWDSMFQEAMVASLAAYLVPALSLHMPLMQMQISIAERMITEARVRDGNEGVTSMDHVPDWIRARSGATGMYWANGGPGGYNNIYNNMYWPAY